MMSTDLTDSATTSPAGAVGAKSASGASSIVPGASPRSGTGSGTAAPRIAVRLFAGAAAEYGADAVTVEASTLQEAIDALLAGPSASAGRVIDRSSFLLNAVACTDREQHLAEGDRLDVLPPFAGG